MPQRKPGHLLRNEEMARFVFLLRHRNSITTLPAPTTRPNAPKPSRNSGISDHDFAIYLTAHRYPVRIYGWILSYFYCILDIKTAPGRRQSNDVSSLKAMS